MLSSPPSTRRLSIRAAIAVLSFLSIVSIQTVGGFAAQQSRERVPGVTNFGRVTDRYFRGGEVSAEGVQQLHAMGVRTIVNLRDKPSPEEETEAKRLGMRYLAFPMTTHATPDPKRIEQVLTIIREADEPVYVHCSAGKHRAGTICALYRMRDQNWTPEQAWAEQAAYGFGPPEEHPELYAFAYGSGPRRAVDAATAGPASDDQSVARTGGTKRDDDEPDDEDADTKRSDDDEESEESDDDDEDEDEDAEDAEDEESDDEGEESDDEAEDDDRDVVAVKAVATESTRTMHAVPATSSAPAAALSTSGSYVTLEDALRGARESGGTGDILKIDLEYDPLLKITTWDFTFASGAEVEVDALSGKVLGSEQKPAGKLAVLSPLGPDAAFTRPLKSFVAIIASAEAAAGRPVHEMELKKIAGRKEILYEVAFDDGSTRYYDATSGGEITGF